MVKGSIHSVGIEVIKMNFESKTTSELMNKLNKYWIDHRGGLNGQKELVPQ